MVDLVGQIRERARRGEAEPNVVAGPEARVHARLRAAVDVDDARAHELQKELGLEGDWNITPDDLIGKQGAGGPLTFLRRLARPGVKLFANLETPLFKQFKINMGIAEALHELLRRTAELEQGLDDVARRLEALEARRAGSAASTDKKSD